MNKCPLVSVVLPAYNASLHIRSAIESILNQTYSNIELIVVNDGSCDKGETECVILEYSDRLKYIKKENGGVASALNAGIDAAKGDYIARMDADDISLPNRIEMQVDYMRNNPQVMVLGTNIQRIDENGKKVGLVQKISDDYEQLKTDLIFSCQLAHPTVLFRREVFDSGYRYDTAAKAEDYDLWTRLVKKYRMTNLQEALLYYRTHGDNTTLIYSKDIMKSAANSSLKYIRAMWNIDISDYADIDTFFDYGIVLQQTSVSHFIEKQLDLLLDIYSSNKENHVANSDCLNRTLEKRLYRIVELFGNESVQALLFEEGAPIRVLERSKQCKQTEFADEIIALHTVDWDGCAQKFNRFLADDYKFVLYGLGLRGKLFLSNIEKYRVEYGFNWKLVGVSDREQKTLERKFSQYEFVNYEELKQVNCDFILVSSEVYFSGIKDELIAAGISPKRIVCGTIFR